LADERSVVKSKVMSMYTDPNRIHADDPGKVEGNPVFIYLNVCDDDKEKVKELEDAYRKGKVGDVAVKQYLAGVMNTFLEPIRQRRTVFQRDLEGVRNILEKGTRKGRSKVAKVLARVRESLHLDYFS